MSESGEGKVKDKCVVMNLEPISQATITRESVRERDRVDKNRC
jgi:hypothetical protein